MGTHRVVHRNTLAIMVALIVAATAHGKERMAMASMRMQGQDQQPVTIGNPKVRITASNTASCTLWKEGDLGRVGARASYVFRDSGDYHVDPGNYLFMAAGTIGGYGQLTCTIWYDDAGKPGPPSATDGGQTTQPIVRGPGPVPYPYPHPQYPQPPPRLAGGTPLGPCVCVHQAQVQYEVNLNGGLGFYEPRCMTNYATHWACQQQCAPPTIPSVIACRQ